MVLMVMLQVVLLSTSLALMPGLTVAGSAQERALEVAKQAATPVAEVKIRLFPKKVSLRPGGKAIFSAWTCPADDWSPFGKDRVPGTADDECEAIRADWSIRNPGQAHLSDPVGHRTRVTLDAPRETKLIALFDGMERRAKVLVKAAPALLRPEASVAKSRTVPEATPTPGIETEAPAAIMAAEPNVAPADVPAEPKATPAADPTEEPAAEPNVAPADVPAAEPTDTPTEEPAAEPTDTPTELKPVANSQELPLVEASEPTDPPSAPDETPAQVSELEAEPSVESNDAIEVSTDAPAEPTEALAEPTEAPAEPAAGLPSDRVATQKPTPQVTQDATVRVAPDAQFEAQGEITPAASVRSATTQFRDTGCLTVPAAFYVGDDACVQATVEIGGGATTSYRVQVYRPGETVPVIDRLFTNSSGSHTHNVDVTFDQPGTWTALVCKTGNAGTCSPGNRLGASTITIGAAPTGSITVEKQTLPDGDPATFDFSGDAAGTIGDGGTITVSDLLPGTYTSTEAVPAGWDLTDISCDDTDSSGDTGSGKATFVLAAGEDVTCTYTNTKRGSILVEKVANGGDGTFAFTGDLGDFSLTTTSGLAQRTFSGLVPGTYDISETVPVGWTLDAALCTGSQSPSAVVLAPGANIKCDFVNTKIPTGSITVEKQTLPDGDPATFDFSGDAAGTIGDGGTITVSDLLPGTYTSTEAVPAGWDLTDISCDDTDSSGDTGSGKATFVLAAGEDVTCTYTNTKRGSILVEKVANGGDGTFAFTGDLGDFSLTTTSGLAQRTFSGLVPGTYDISETVPVGWTLDAALCTGSQSPSAVVLAPGANIKCDFVNTKIPTGSITVEKQTLPDGDPATFDFSGDAAGTIGDGGTITVSDLLPGTYTSTEAVPAGWDLTDISCDDTDSSGDTGSGKATFVLAAGEDVTCTYTNTKRGSILVEKVANGGDGTFAFTGDLGDFSLTTTSGLAQRTFSGLVPGTYDISETVPVGWTLDAALCTGSQSPSAVVLAPGANIKCDFVNTKIPTGSITVEKQTLPDGDPATFDFSGDAAGTIGDGGTITVSDLLPGTYTSTEAVPAGWDLTDISCDDTDSSGDTGSGKATFVLAAGEDVTCTYTNTKRGSILVEKVANGGDGTFAFTGDLGDFSLTTTSGLAQRTFSGLVPGTYDISETVPVGWTLDAALCTGSQSPSAVVLAPGANIKCDFVNTKIPTGSITVEKQTLPDGDPATFDFSGDAAGTIGDGGTITVSDLLPGTYTSTEAVPAGWDLTDISCDDTDSSGDTGSGKATFVLAAGEDVTCTYTNTKRGSILVTKATDPAGGTGFEFTGDAQGTIDDGVSITVKDLAAGQYTSTEVVPEGWYLSDITCDDDDSTGDVGTATATFNVANGEIVECTFTNWELSVIVVEKVTDPAGDPTSFDFTTDAGPAFSLAHGESKALTSLEPGTYSVSEDTPTDWALAQATCDNGDTPDAIELVAGEVVTCTFTNVADPGSITIKKVTDPSPDPTGTNFTFSGDVSGTIGNGGQIVRTDLAPGTYTATELVPLGWTVGSIVCDDDDSTGDRSTATATVALAAGEDVSCTFTNLASDVGMAVGKTADRTNVSVAGEEVTFTFSVTNTGDVAFVIASMSDDVYGSLDGDADCRVSTVLQPGAWCAFEETFTVKPSVTPDPNDPDQVIPDHVNTFESCSILSSGPLAVAALGTAAAETCASAAVTIGFEKIVTRPGQPGEVVTRPGQPGKIVARPVQPEATLQPTDMLPDTDGSGAADADDGGLGPLAWILVTILGAGVIIGAGFVVRNRRRQA